MRDELVADVVGFARALRVAGLAIGIDQIARCAEALALIDPPTRQNAHLAARATLVYRQPDLAIFEREFARWLGDRGDELATPRPMPLAPRHDPQAHQTALVAYIAQRASPSDPDIDVPERRKAASSLELLHRADFAECTDEERRALARAMRELRLEIARRTSRRFEPAHRGDRLDLPRIVRAAAKHGGVPVVLARRRPKIKPRPLVVIADISGSMELYARLLLQFLHGLAHRHRPTEVFVFGTRLTRLTHELALRDPDEALDRAARAIADYGGGTRIADSLHELNRRYARRLIKGDTVVLIASDGWETGDPAALAHEVAKLHARAHRLIWLNPLLGREGYEPRVRGMAAALAHVDDFLPIHNLNALQQLADHLGRLSRRKGEVAHEARR